MSIAQRVAVSVVLLAGIFMLLLLGLPVFGPESWGAGIAALMERRWVLIAVEALWCAALLTALVALARTLLAHRPDRGFVHVTEGPALEVSLAALETSVRVAIEATDEFLVERVEGRTRGREAQSAMFAVDVIPLVEEGLQASAARAEERAQAACERLVGAPVAFVTLRVLPAKTYTVVEELDDER